MILIAFALSDASPNRTLLFFATLKRKTAASLFAFDQFAFDSSTNRVHPSSCSSVRFLLFFFVLPFVALSLCFKGQKCRAMRPFHVAPACPFSTRVRSLCFLWIALLQFVLPIVHSSSLSSHSTFISKPLMIEATTKLRPVSSSIASLRHLVIVPKLALLLHPTGKALAVQTQPFDPPSVGSSSFKANPLSSTTLVRFAPASKTIKSEPKLSIKSKPTKMWSNPSESVGQDKWIPMVTDQTSSKDDLEEHDSQPIRDQIELDNRLNLEIYQHKSPEHSYHHRPFNHALTPYRLLYPNSINYIDESFIKKPMLTSSSPSSVVLHTVRPLSKSTLLVAPDSSRDFSSPLITPSHRHTLPDLMEQQHRPLPVAATLTFKRPGLPRSPHPLKPSRPELHSKHNHNRESHHSHYKKHQHHQSNSNLNDHSLNRNHHQHIFSHDVELKFRQSTIEEDLKLINWIGSHYDLFSSGAFKKLPVAVMADQMRQKQNQYFGFPLIDTFSYDHFDKETTQEEKLFEQNAPYQHSANPGLRDMVRRLHQLEASYHERPHWHKFLVKAFLNLVTNPLRRR